MKVEFLISTMNRTSLDFLSDMFRQIPIDKVNAIVVNQCTKIAPPSDIHTPSPNIKVFSVAEEGLSRSRNRALAKASGDICVITDDDYVYSSDCVETILEAYSDIPQADLIAFRSYSSSTGKPRKTGGAGVRRRNQFTIGGISSSGLTFRFIKVSDASIRFDKRFGLGSQYPVGEENIFLRDCVAADLKLYSHPAFILTTDENSTGYKVIGQPELRGKVFRRMYSSDMLFMLSTVYTSVRKYPIYKNDIGLLSYIKWMWRGARDMRDI